MKKTSKNQDFTYFLVKFLTDEDFSDKDFSDKDCLEYFKRIRWKRGFVCPDCGKKAYWTIAPYKYKCRSCNRQTTVTAGTFFHSTHLTMPKWFRAIYYCCEKGNHATTKGLKSFADIGSYRIAQSTLKKIKEKMDLNDNDKLEWINTPLHGDVKIGIIETDQISINNTPIDIVIAAEYKGKKIRRRRIFVSDKLHTYENKEKKVEQLLKPKYVTLDSNITYDLSCAKKILKDFKDWCKGKKTKGFTELSRSYCRIYDCLNMFDTVLENMVKP